MDVVVVTGASGGIGAAIATALFDRGLSVIGIDLGAEVALGVEGAGAFTGRGGAYVAGSVVDPDVHGRALDEARRIGTLVGWVNAAGIADAASVHEVTFDHYRSLFDVNFGGTLLGVSAAVRGLRASGGSIVSLSSTQAQGGLPGYPVYAATKGAIDALTKQVAAEFAPLGIRCNAIAPGVIATPMNQRILAESDDPDALKAVWDGLCPIGRWGTPEDVAALASYLIGPESGFLTGQVITIDGGQTITSRVVQSAD